MTQKITKAQKWGARAILGGKSQTTNGIGGAPIVGTPSDGDTIIYDITTNTYVYGPATGDPAADTLVWMPLTTVVAGVPELVWDADDSLIPTLTPV